MTSHPSSLNLQPWRASAPAGLSLAEAQRLAPPITRAAAPAAGSPVLLEQIIRPEARSRWLLPSAAYLTPSYIETILRGAIAGNLVQQWELFSLMEDTWPRLTKNLNEVKREAQRFDWKLEAWAEEDQPPTDSAQERMKLVSQALWAMRPQAARDENAFEGTLFDILDAWGKGTSVLEVLWENRDAGGDLGEIVAPRATTWVHPQNYNWSADGQLGLIPAGTSATTGFLDLRPTNASEVIPFPEDKFLVAICKARSGHPAAGALLRPLAFWWSAANFTQSWFLNFAQIFGLPIRWATYDPNTPGLMEKVSAMLENMGSSAWGAFPLGTTFELKESAKAGADNPQVAILDRADRNCDILILGQTLTTDVAGSGSRALGDVHNDVRGGILQAAAEFAASVINLQLIPSILRLNYGDDAEAPEMCPEPREQEDEQANAERDQILLQAGVEMPKGWFYKRHNIPLPQPGEDVIAGRPVPDPNALPFGSAGLPTQGERRHLHAENAATVKLVDNVLEKLTHVEARWLSAAKPHIYRLIALAQSEKVTDAELIKAIEGLNQELPELFHDLDTEALSTAMEHAMTAGLVNGAARGFMRRPGRGSPRRSAAKTGGAA